MFEPVGLATAMVPLTGMEVNRGATTEALETAERVTMLALGEVLDGQGLTMTVELAAMEELLCRRVRVRHPPEIGSFHISQNTTYAAVGIIAAAGAEEAMDMGAAELLAVTGQMVVETAMVLVTTMVEWAGHEVTVGAQLVMVISWVE